MKRAIISENDVINFVDSKTQSLRIGARSAWVGGLLLTLELSKTDAASPAPYQDWMMRSMQALTLMGGKHPYLALGGSDMGIAYWMLRNREQGRGRAPDWVAGSVTFFHQMAFLFGPTPLNSDESENLHEPNAGIPPDTDLTLSVQWGAAAATGANTTIATTTKLHVSYLELIPQTRAEEPKMIPQWSSIDYTPPQTYKALQGGAYLDPGLYYRRIHVVAKKGASPNDLRSDSIAANNGISAIGFRTSDGRFPISLPMVDFAQLSQRNFRTADDNGAVPGAVLAPGLASVKAAWNPGVGMLDMARIADTSDARFADPLWGVNMQGKSPTSGKIAMTIDNIADVKASLGFEAYKAL